jgi:hypothetical protein
MLRKHYYRDKDSSLDSRVFVVRYSRNRTALGCSSRDCGEGAESGEVGDGVALISPVPIVIEAVKRARRRAHPGTRKVLG